MSQIQPENAAISNELFERIDTMFSDMMQDYISESGFRYELDFNEEDYLEQFSFEHKVNYVIDNLEVKLGCSRVVIKHYQSKEK